MKPHDLIVTDPEEKHQDASAYKGCRGPRARADFSGVLEGSFGPL